jgi:hypothetical protein
MMWRINARRSRKQHGMSGEQEEYWLDQRRDQGLIANTLACLPPSYSPFHP